MFRFQLIERVVGMLGRVKDHGGDESVLEQSRGAEDHALLGSSGELGFRSCGKVSLAQKSI